jgi:outer membrane murein-binding lipoprotein Lpp
MESTEKKVDELSAQFKKTNDQMQAQSQQAAAAKASLDAIPTGYNNVIPTS